MPRGRPAASAGAVTGVLPVGPAIRKFKTCVHDPAKHAAAWA